MQAILSIDKDAQEEAGAAEKVNHLSELLLQHWLIHEESVRFCPAEGCGYAGLIAQIDPVTGLIPCCDPFACSKCGTEWTDPLLQRND